MAKDTDVQPRKTVNIYISYASGDNSLYEMFRKHMTVIERYARDYKLIISNRNGVPPGLFIREECEKNLNAAHIILLLISSSFVKDDQCIVDMDGAMKRHKTESSSSVIVIPIKLGPVAMWEKLPASILRSLPSNDIPIAGLGRSEKDAAFSKITDALSNLIDKMLPNIPLVATPAPVIPPFVPASPVSAVKGSGKEVTDSKYSEAEVRRHVVILKGELAYLYDDPANMRNILQNVGIQAHNVSLGGPPTAAWTNIVEYAQRRKKLLELAAEAFRAFPEDDILAAEVPYWQGYYKQ